MLDEKGSKFLLLNRIEGFFVFLSTCSFTTYGCSTGDGCGLDDADWLSLLYNDS